MPSRAQILYKSIKECNDLFSLLLFFSDFEICWDPKVAFSLTFMIVAPFAQELLLK